MLIGIDEVGRGAWAGPLLVVAASGVPSPNVTDSKLLTRKRRETIIAALNLSCVFGEGWVQPAEIDRHGLTKSMQLGVARALRALGAKPSDEIIIDGHINYCSKMYTNVKAIVKADQSVPVVSAASIYAKVTRDNEMALLSAKHPGYSFEEHVGYGTQAHQQALQLHGVSAIHRRSYKPVAAYL